jgi:hypothetical protein
MKRVTIILGLCALLVIGCGQRVAATKAVEFSAQIGQEQSFSMNLPNDDITISVQPGAPGECKGTAKVTAYAYNARAATNEVENAKVTIERDEESVCLVVSPDKPHFSVEVSVTLPKGTAIELSSRNGSIVAAGADGDLTASSVNGSVVCKDVSGKMSLNSDNGSVQVDYSADAARSPKIEATSQNGAIACTDIAGDLDLDAHNGSVAASYSSTASPSPTVVIKSQNGSIDFAPPANLDAKLDISTHNGSIASSLKGSIHGKVEKKAIEGTVGEGKGSIEVWTQNGSINLHE